jgi:hypothetical protein
MNHSDEFHRAKSRLEARRGFFTHLTVFIVVNTALLFLNLATAPDDLWVRWPVMGWGIGVAFHALAVFVIGDRSSISDDMVEREMNKRPRA